MDRERQCSARRLSVLQILQVELGGGNGNSEGARIVKEQWCSRRFFPGKRNRKFYDILEQALWNNDRIGKERMGLAEQQKDTREFPQKFQYICLSARNFDEEKSK